MATNFHDAHDRHLLDAEYLFNLPRLANADHLYGFSVECGLKRLMEAFGMPMDPRGTGPSNRSDRVHANHVWMRFESYRSRSPQGVRYVLPSVNPFSNWDVADRYEEQAFFHGAHVAPHRQGAGVVARLLRFAVWEGLV